MRPINADLLDRELENNKIVSDWIKVNESYFEPLSMYATCTISTIQSTCGYGIPIGRRYSQCDHCGAPGQVVGRLCEYCGQVIDG